MMALNARTRFWCGDGRVWRVLAVLACALSVIHQASAQEGVTKYNSKGEPCMCVWYYLCTGNETTGTIKQHGEDIIEPRLGIPKPKEPTCDEGVTHICCKLPANQTRPAEPEPQPVPQPVPVPKPSPQPSPQPIPRPQPDIEPEAVPVTIPRPGCGVKRIPVTSRVTDLSEDNSTAYYAEFPWMLVVVTEQQPGVYKFECGASLIQPQVALTAAHCIQNLDQRRLKVRAGEWNTRSTAEPSPHQDRSVRAVIVHPSYAPGPLFNDIALVVLNEPFDTADNVDTICIPVQDANFDGSRCYATGWGKDSFDQSGSYHHILRKVDLPIVPRQECQSSLRKTRLGPFFRLHNSFVCAGGEPEKDTCKGDGGGPLVCPIGDTDRWTQVGIVSWGIDCGTNNPAVYVNVPMYTEWILSEIDAIRRRQPPRGPPGPGPRPQRRRP